VRTPSCLGRLAVLFEKFESPIDGLAEHGVIEPAGDGIDDGLVEDRLRHVQIVRADARPRLEL
jgi:hypothetical protein